MTQDLGKWLLIAFVLVFGILAWRAWQTKQASTQWPYVEGVIEHVRVFPNNERQDTTGRPVHDWRAEVRYRYTVNGETYTGRRLRAMDAANHLDEASARASLGGVSVGQRVKVYYDPARPSSSVLFPG